MKLRFRKNDPEHNLLAATQHWVEANYGALVVVGGIEVQTWPGDNAHNFRVAVKCTGRAPEVEHKAKAAELVKSRVDNEVNK